MYMVIYIYIYGYESKPWYLVNPKIAGKWMFIPLKMVLIEPSVAIRQGQGVADGVSRPNGQRKEMHSLAPWPWPPWPWPKRRFSMGKTGKTWEISRNSMGKDMGTSRKPWENTCCFFLMK